jgi:hypothetical protein
MTQLSKIVGVPALAPGVRHHDFHSLTEYDVGLGECADGDQCLPQVVHGDRQEAECPVTPDSGNGSAQPRHGLP